MIEIKHVTKTFGSKKAVDDLDLTIPTGEIIGFIGPNGAGKTTTIKMMTGVLNPDEGDILINGKSIQKEPLVRPPPRLRDGNPHGQFRPCRVRLFQERHHHNRRRQNGAGTGSGSRCYTGANLSGVSWGMEKAATPESVAVKIDC